MARIRQGLKNVTFLIITGSHLLKMLSWCCLFLCAPWKTWEIHYSLKEDVIYAFIKYPVKLILAAYLMMYTLYMPFFH